MNNRSTVYVIGLTQFNLLNIEGQWVYTKEFGMILMINKVTHGIMNMCNATQIRSKEDAQKILQEIKDNREGILFRNETILESIIEGNDLDVDNLHIYEIDMRITREVN